CLNWKSPGDFTLQLNGNTTFHTDLGFSMSTHSVNYGWISSGFQPATHAVQMQDMASSFFFRLGQEQTEENTSRYVIGTNTNYLGCRPNIGSDAAIGQLQVTTVTGNIVEVSLADGNDAVIGFSRV